MKLNRYQVLSMGLLLGLATSVSTLARADAPLVTLTPTQGTQQMVQAGAASSAAPDAMSQMRRNQMSLLSKLDFLQREIQDLRGRQEVQQHELALMQKRQLSLYKDLDQRLTKLGSNGNAAEKQQLVQGMQQDVAALKQQSQAYPVASPQTNPASPAPAGTHITIGSAGKSASTNSIAAATTANAGSAAIAANNADKARMAYHQAYQLINERQYSSAVASMQAFLSEYPTSQYVPNAHYWLGELYLVQGLNDKAINEFDTVIKNYPNSPKTADAMLKLGYISQDQRNWAQARAQLNKVISTYPNTTSAQLAKARLQQMSRAGN